MSSEHEGHPVAAGLAALIGVGVVVGLLVSGGSLAVSSYLGLSGSDGAATSTARESLFLPKPIETESASGPLLTLAPVPGGSSPTLTTISPSVAEFPITLTAGVDQVSPMQEIPLAGTYPVGEGAVVQVQRMEEGAWEDFATVDAVVSNGTFATFVQTAKPGTNIFRVRDTDSDVVSNQVQVSVG